MSKDKFKSDKENKIPPFLSNPPEIVPIDISKFDKLSSDAFADMLNEAEESAGIDVMIGGDDVIVGVRGRYKGPESSSAVPPQHMSNEQKAYYHFDLWQDDTFLRDRQNFSFMLELIRLFSDMRKLCTEEIVSSVVIPYYRYYSFRKWLGGDSEKNFHFKGAEKAFNIDLSNYNIVKISFEEITVSVTFNVDRMLQKPHGTMKGDKPHVI